MNGLIIITNRQKLIICFAALVFIILSAFIIANLDFPKVVETKSSDVNIALSPEIENHQLKDILSSILPADNKILFENDNRGISTSVNKSLKPENDTPSAVISKGKNLAFRFVYNDEDYLRPIYSNTWKQSYYQGWLYLPRKVVSSRHNLFTYVGGVGKMFDIEGELGFYPNITIDNQNYINFLVYNFDLENIVQLGSQIVLTGTPMKKGVQIISVKAEDIAVQTVGNKQLSISLSTPKGFEIDYQNVLFSESSNQIEDFGPVEESYVERDSAADVAMQNSFLKQELAHFISDSSKPIYFQHNGSYKTSNVLNVNIDLSDALVNSLKVKYSLVYDNSKYTAPVYHPQWKENYDRDWCYIPRKMYLNMKNLFVIPSDKEIAKDLYGELGFFEKYPAIDGNHTGLLINNFKVKNVSTYEDNLLIQGIPARTGLQIISISKKSLAAYKEYAARLVTSDSCEIDVDVIKN